MKSMNPKPLDAGLAESVCVKCSHNIGRDGDGSCTGCSNARYPPWWPPLRIEAEGKKLTNKFSPKRGWFFRAVTTVRKIVKEAKEGK